VADNWPRCITVSGFRGTGTTTLARELANRIGFEYFNLGQMYREHCLLVGLTLEALPGLPDEFHQAADGLLRLRIKSDSSAVIEARTAGWFARPFADVFSVYLHAPIKTRLSRLRGRDPEIPLTAESLLSDDAAHVAKWMTCYGFDYHNTSIYDLTLDSSQHAPADLVTQVVSATQNCTRLKLAVPRQPVVGVGLVIARGNKLLLAKRLRPPGKGTYGCCGGKLNYGEAIEACLRREAKEEFGIEIQDLRFITVTNIVHEDSHFVDLTFRASVAPGAVPTIQEPDRFDSLDWYPFTDLPHPLFAPVANALALPDSKAFKEMYGFAAQLALFPDPGWLPGGRSTVTSRPHIGTVPELQDELWSNV